jgi:Rieske Fe-S protein
MQDMNRREFVAMAATACAACACGASQSLAAEKAGPVDAGLASQYSRDGISDKFLKSHHFFLVRSQGKLFAVSGICTHKGGALILNPADHTRIKCTKHDSVFDVQGQVLHPPARSGLARLGISLDEQKHVVVDAAKKFEQGHWDQAGSYLTV